MYFNLSFMMLMPVYMKHPHSLKREMYKAEEKEFFRLVYHSLFTPNAKEHLSTLLQKIVGTPAMSKEVKATANLLLEHLKSNEDPQLQATYFIDASVHLSLLLNLDVNQNPALKKEDFEISFSEHRNVMSKEVENMKMFYLFSFYYLQRDIHFFPNNAALIDYIKNKINEYQMNKEELRKQREAIEEVKKELSQLKGKLNTDISTIKEDISNDVKELIMSKLYLIDQLKKENEELKQEIKRLSNESQSQIEALMNESKESKSQIEALKKENKDMKVEIFKMKKQIEELTKENAKLKETISQLQGVHNEEKEILNNTITNITNSREEIEQKLQTSLYREGQKSKALINVTEEFKKKEGIVKRQLEDMNERLRKDQEKIKELEKERKELEKKKANEKADEKSIILDCDTKLMLTQMYEAILDMKIQLDKNIGCLDN